MKAATITAGLRLAALALALAALPALAAPATADAARRPNLIVITTDDQTLASMSRETMPFTSRFFTRRGTEFTNAVVVSPSCCPSRAAFLSGQYSHNNGVFGNFPGYPTLKGKGNTLPVWLNRAGYRTAHVGKFLNRYGSVDGWRTPAPGFDDWYTLVTYKYNDYKIASKNRILKFGSRNRDYLTRRLNRRAKRFITHQARRGKPPVYLQLDQFAPHSETGASDNACTEAAQPDPLDFDLFANEPLPQESLPPDARSFNERDTSDKSPVLAGMRKLSDFVISKIERRYRCQLAALRGVDRGVARLHAALKRTGSLRRTAIVFTSDNGFFHGEHRLPNNKGFPYEEGIRVPLMISLPRSMRQNPPNRLDETVANIDITASLIELARAKPCNSRGRCRQLDGRSLVGLLTGSDGSWPANRRVLIEQSRPQFLCAPYSAVWEPSTLLVEYPTEEGAGGCRTEREAYEMRSDPMQLENIYPATPGTARAEYQDELTETLRRLRRCSGIEGRDRARGARPFCE